MKHNQFLDELFEWWEAEYPDPPTPEQEQLLRQAFMENLSKDFKLLEYSPAWKGYIDSDGSVIREHAVRSIANALGRLWRWCEGRGSLSQTMLAVHDVMDIGDALGISGLGEAVEEFSVLSKKKMESGLKDEDRWKKEH